jgi:hypothetical protein
MRTASSCGIDLCGPVRRKPVVRTVTAVDAEEAYRLCSYRPLSSTGAGRRASAEFSIPGFVDGSCRREPDFQARYPSITTLCRYDRFAPHLQVGHRIAYITVKGEYGEEDPHWRLVACLRVIKRFESHDDAAAWYRSKRLHLPSNCMVSGNSPLPLDRTMSPRRNLRSWNAGYVHRAKSLGTFLVCETEALDLVAPPKLTERDFLRIFGRVRSTRTPPKITASEYEKLLRLLRKR